MTTNTIQSDREEIESLVLTPNCDWARLTELLENVKARDYLLYLSATASEKNYKIVKDNLTEAFQKSLVHGSAESITATATVLAMSLWAVDDEDDDIDLLLAKAKATASPYSLLDLCLKGRLGGLPSSVIKFMVIEAEED